MTEPDETPERSRVHQEVRVENGFGYGVIGADLHVFADRGPVYVLEEFRQAPDPESDWLVELPSRMLNARYAVVDFTGRHDELDQLRQWRETGPRLAARWLHAPGGQGKTRLAAQFAQDSIAAGWKVVTATHGPGSILPPPGSQDLRLTGKAGVLLIIDYADRWPLSHVTWLLSNALLHQSAIPARVLMLARSADVWPAVRAALANHQAGTSTQRLPDLPDDTGQRTGMFAAARDGFASRYAMDDPARIRPPSSLGQPGFGLLLAVHMAALVAVDAHVTGRRPPSDIANLTVYLLDREHLHWANLYEGGEHELNPTDRTFRSPPAVMNQTVFTAALTGPVAHAVASSALRSLHVPLATEQILADHTLCYPPAAPAGTSVLEPLYPDRLAEDFIALTLPGHPADYPAQPWAAPTATTLLSGDDRVTPDRVARPLTFLAAAAQRWPHVGPSHLYPILHESPELAVTAGSAALSALADLDDIAPELLEVIASRFPAGRSVDLDIGMSAVIVRLAAHRLIHATDPWAEFAIHDEIGDRLHNVGRYPQELKAREQAVALARRLVEDQPAPVADTTADSAVPERTPLASLRVEPIRMLAYSLRDLSRCLHSLRRDVEALEASEEAVTLCRQVVRARPGVHDAELGHALYTLGSSLSNLGRRAQALVTAAEAVEVFRRLAKADPPRYEKDLAVHLAGFGASLTDAGRISESVEATEEAVNIIRRYAQSAPDTHEPRFAEILLHFSFRLGQAKRRVEATDAAAEAVAVYRRLARVNPSAYEPGLAKALQSWGISLVAMERMPDAIAACEEAVTILRRLSQAIPAAYEPKLVEAMFMFASCLFNDGQRDEALPIMREQLPVYRRLVQGSPDAYEHQFMMLLLSFSVQCAETRSEITEGLRAFEEAIALYHRRPEHVPSIFNERYQSTGGTIADVLNELGRQEEATELHRKLGALAGPGN